VAVTVVVPVTVVVVHHFVPAKKPECGTPR
jgi:hypothetical protein